MTLCWTHTLVGKGEGSGRPCRLLRTWRGRGPHNVLVATVDKKLIVPLRRLRKVRREEAP